MNDHTGDAMSLALNPTDENMFVSGSCDATAKVHPVFAAHSSSTTIFELYGLGTHARTQTYDTHAQVWDKRAPQKATHSFAGHESDINSGG